MCIVEAQKGTTRSCEAICCSVACCSYETLFFTLFFWSAVFPPPPNLSSSSSHQIPLFISLSSPSSSSAPPLRLFALDTITASPHRHSDIKSYSPFSSAVIPRSSTSLFWFHHEPTKAGSQLRRYHYKNHQKRHKLQGGLQHNNNILQKPWAASADGPLVPVPYLAVHHPGPQPIRRRCSACRCTDWRQPCQPV